jgi:3-oxoacyl-[acyl-carrier-protein] synthase-3
MSKDAYITGCASFLPNQPISNDEMEAVLGQAGPKPSRARKTILRSNGIKTRYYAIDPATRQATHSNAQLAAEAVKTLLASQADSDQTLDCLSCATSMADQLMPSHASMVHGELDIPIREVVATAGVCLAGISALKYAAMAIKSGEHQKAVACASERSSMGMRAENYATEVDALVDQLNGRPELAFEKDFLRWMLSDGAGALLLEPHPSGKLSLRIDWIEMFSFADEMSACMYAGAIKNEDGSLRYWQDIPQIEREKQSVFAVKQDVKQLNEHIISYTVGRGLSQVQEKYRIAPQQIDWYLPHYSSHFFRDKVSDEMKRIGFGIPDERWFTNLYTKGNTGSASIYIMLDELFHSDRLKKDQRILCYIPESSRFSSGFMHLTVV